MGNFKSLALPDFFDIMWKDFDNLFERMSPSDVYRDINYPPMNLWVDKDSKDIIMEFAVAGIPEENIDINVEGDYLELSVAKHEETERDNYKLVRKGIKSGSVKQRIYVPASKYETENIKAELDGGILYVKVPSKEEMKPKKVQIQSPGGKTKKLE